MLFHFSINKWFSIILIVSCTSKSWSEEGVSHQWELLVVFIFHPLSPSLWCNGLSSLYFTNLYHSKLWCLFWNILKRDVVWIKYYKSSSLLWSVWSQMWEVNVTLLSLSHFNREIINPEKCTCQFTLEVLPLENFI